MGITMKEGEKGKKGKREKGMRLKIRLHYFFFFPLFAFSPFPLFPPGLHHA
jgi:hypothetical protein